MWAQVLERDGEGGLHGRLRNTPACLGSLDLVAFEPSNVLTIDFSDEELESVNLMTDRFPGLEEPLRAGDGVWALAGGGIDDS